MDFYKAISILGLNENFTEEEFKSAYRKLSHEFHPDKYEGSPQYETMQRKQQEINAAREFLKKNPPKPPSKNTVTIQNYIQYKKEKLIKLISDEGAKILDKDYETTLNAIKKMISKFEIDVCNTYIITKDDVDEAYEECIKSIKNKYSNLKDFFYKIHHINKEEVQEQLNYDCTLKEFYEQLQKVEEKYGQKAKIKQQLLIEIQKYQYFAGYEKLEKLINVSLNNALIRIKENNFQDIQQQIDNMHQEILEIFQIYHTLAQTIRELAPVVSSTKNEVVENAYETLKKDFQDGRSFQDIELEIKQLKELIQEHQKQMQKVINFRKNEQAINNIYKSLMDKFNKVIKNYNIITEQETITKLNEFLQQILKLFIKGCEELKDLEYFNTFNNITFTDINNDKEVIDKIIQPADTDSKTYGESQFSNNEKSDNPNQRKQR